jgi:hypothetical protein
MGRAERIGLKINPGNHPDYSDGCLVQMDSMTSDFEWVSNEALRVGDVVRIYGSIRWRITAIRPYRGPLTDIIFGLADTDQGPGFSLERGGMSERAVLGAHHR